MISHFSTLLVFLIITFATDVHSACFQGQVSAKITSKTFSLIIRLIKSRFLFLEYGTVDTQCAFNNIKVLPGSSFKLPYPDCLDCKCTAKSMTCCGFGFAAGTVVPPPGCIAHNDACKLILVNEKNSSEICKPNKDVSNNKKKLLKPPQKS
jgi:hypothetical protein